MSCRRLSVIFLVTSLALSPVLIGANRLADSQSPYLLQHAENPVNWFPWGEAAFAKAKSENKLILVSIGYSTCHWCHVMNRETFSDEKIAAYLNEHYVCIKIDREERPDIDNVYMAFVQTLRGSAGWPLNVFLTPDKKPFYGGTYFPPYNDPERGAGFYELCQEISQNWKTNPDSISKRSQEIYQILNTTAANATGTAEVKLTLEPLTDSVTAFLFQFDDKNKGFGKGEKFPSPTTLSLLLRAAATPELHPEDRELAKRMALETLDTMLLSGLYDHVGGGFHRYSVDPAWKLPHFEKMLYDQALIVQSLIDAWQLTGEQRYKRTACETLDYLLRDMRHPEGGFFSAEDAESTDPQKPDTKREGAYYLWTEEELAEVFPDSEEQERLFELFEIKANGNAPTGPFPTKVFDGYNNIRLQTLTTDQERLLTDKAFAKLAKIRSVRERPHRDDKIITAWNGLAISALARAGLVFDRHDYAQAAEQAAHFIFENLYDPESSSLARLFREEASKVEGFAEDYAFLIKASLDLYESSADHRWVQRARELQNAQDLRFLDTEHGGYFLYEASDHLGDARPKLPVDPAIPAAAAISIENLVRLSQLYDDSKLQKRAEITARSHYPSLSEKGTKHPELLQALLSVTKKPLQVVLAGKPISESTRTLLDIYSNRLLPNALLIYADQAEGQTFLSKKLTFLQTAHPFGDATTAFLCENFVCQMPTDEPERFSKQIDARTQASR